MPVPDKLLSMMDDVATAKINHEGSGPLIRSGPAKALGQFRANPLALDRSFGAL